MMPAGAALYWGAKMSHPFIEELEPTEVARLLAENEILLVDVREPDEYAVQRIAGALLYPLSSFDAEKLPPDSPRRLVFHCGSGRRSASAASERISAGGARAAHMAGGIGAWKAAGLPVISVDPATGKLVTG